MDAVAHGSLRAAQLFSVQGKVALVTGGGRGIGEMVARALVENGARVYIASRSQSALARTAAALSAAGPGSCSAIAADVSSDAGCRALAASVHAAEQLAAAPTGAGGGPGAAAVPALDILVNNSGISWGAPFESFPEEQFDRVLALNLKAPFLLTRACRPMLEAAAARAGGAPARVVNVGSTLGLRTQPVPTYSYEASKAALHHLTAKLSHEFAPRITVNAIAPGFVPTRMARGLLTVGSAARLQGSIPMARFGSAADIGGAALFLCSPAGAWVTGSVLVVDGGTAATPLSLFGEDDEKRGALR